MTFTGLSSLLVICTVPWQALLHTSLLPQHKDRYLCFIFGEYSRLPLLLIFLNVEICRDYYRISPKRVCLCSAGSSQTVCFSEETKDEIDLDVLDDVAWCQIQKLTVMHIPLKEKRDPSVCIYV